MPNSPFSLTRVVLIASLYLIISSPVFIPTSVFADAVNYSEKSITVALTQEPPNLNSLRATDLVSFFVLGHVNEGLVRYDKQGRLSGGVAESWVLNPTEMVFTLRSDARWSNGESVTAKDFVFAWRKMVDPVMASPYGAILYPVKNAEQIHKGKLSVDKLGIKAVGDKKLIVELETPCGYCLGLMTHLAFYPVNEKFYRSMDRVYGAEFDKILYNGPFKIESWVHDTSLFMVKNEFYWNKDQIRLNRLNVGYITSDNRTRLNLFRDNQMALVRLGAETVKDALNQGMRLKTFVTGGMSFLRFNLSPDRIASHPEFRKAVQMIVDTEIFTNKVISMPGYKPAFSFFPSWLKGSKKAFVREYPPRRIHLDQQKAKEQLSKLELRIESDLPSVTLLTVSSPTGAKIAEYFQGLFKEKLGLKVKVDQQTFKQYLDKNNKGEFDIALSSWYPDFDDLVTYADLLASWNPNNRGRYKSEEYDRWLSVLQRSVDANERFSAASRLQELIILNAPVIPLAETGSSYLQHPQLKGVVRRVLGADPDYTYAWIKEKEN